jgi:hypothetical protein
MELVSFSDFPFPWLFSAWVAVQISGFSISQAGYPPSKLHKNTWHRLSSCLLAHPSTATSVLWTMSSGPAENGATPVYNDPEKGTLDIVSPRSVVAPFYPQDEKMRLTHNPPTLKKPSAPAKPAPKRKARASRWIIFTLWFNTYRSTMSRSQLLNIHSHGVKTGNSLHWYLL